MRQQIMKVSPAVFSEIQRKAAEAAIHRTINPKSFDLFAAWAHETFGCVYYTEYKVTVVWEWGNLWKWSFPQEAVQA